MADFSKFRTSLNGFHRLDVALYIETLCAEHQNELKQAQAEMDHLKQLLSASASALTEQKAKNETLQKKLEETEAELQSTETALQSTEAALDEALTMLTEAQDAAAEEEMPEPEASDVQEAEEVPPDYLTLELEAYRRAEAMERNSAERSARMRQQLNNLLDQLSSRYEQTGTEIQALTDDIRSNLLRLQESLSDLDIIFEETTQTFDTMDADALTPEAE